MISVPALAINLFFLFGPVAAIGRWIATAIGGKELFGAVMALVASFVGAGFAFELARRQRTHERENNEVSAGNRALFILTKMYNELRQHQRDVVASYRDRPDARLNLNVSSPLSQNLTFDIKELTFVMQAAPETFQQLMLEESRFQLSAYLIEEHRRISVTEAWPRLETAGIRLNDQRDQNEIENIVGVATVQKLREITGAIITHFDANVISSLAAFNSLRVILKTIYQKRKFIMFRPYD
jgi:hypothetical protein